MCRYHSIFYTNSKFRVREAPVEAQLRNIGFSTVTPYRREWLEKSDFYLENQEILDMPRGDGYWLWKPFIILETMKNIKENEIVYYTDAGDDIRDPNILNLIKSHMVNNDYMIGGSSGRPINKRFIKRDCFILMDCDEEKYHNVSQIEAGTLVFKNNETMVKLLQEWLSYCKNKYIITDLPNICGSNYPEFVDHRHDQSILTLLTIKYGMKWNETLYSYIRHNSFIP